jgi:hypothetical protein
MGGLYRDALCINVNAMVVRGSSQGWRLARSAGTFRLLGW